MKLEKLTDDRPRGFDDACGTALALEFVGERWALLVMRELMYGPRRFGEIRANLPGISANVLTQRLVSLAEAGIVVRRTLPSPANVPVYDLTPWGREAAPAMRAMGRWAARSPRHDPLLFMSAASAMMSLETLVDHAALAAAPPPPIAVRIGADHFVAAPRDGAMTVVRGEAVGAAATLTGDTMALRRTIYGKLGFDGEGLLALEGDRAAAERFVALFRLPDQVA